VVSLADSESNAWHLDGRTGFFRTIYYRNIDRIVAVSPALFRALKRWRPGKAVLITCSARDDQFVPMTQEDRRLARKELGIPEVAVVFITIGSVGVRKGHDVLARAFGSLAGKHPDWCLMLVGPMSREEGCHTEANEIAEMMAPLQPFGSQVRRMGRVDDRTQIRRLLGVSDIFVFPTRREGMPIAPMEAMAMGLPVIVSRITDVTDVACVEQETGFFVPVGDAEALARAMERLGSDAGLRAKFGSQARQRIEDELSWEQHMQRWEDLYSRAGGDGELNFEGIRNPENRSQGLSRSK
jgi:glycosyltransferase involved in cell wall biosynthesis